MESPAARHRVVLLGASNMTRGFAALSDLCFRTWPAPLSLVGAIGHGRSFGLRSSVFGRALPGILDCGLWPALDGAGVPTVAFVGDVGNDLLYGASVETILQWVEETLLRLQRLEARIVVTSLPPQVRTISRGKFLFYRNLLFPWSRLRFEDLAGMVAALEGGLRELANRYGAAWVVLRPEWYAVDPIHISPFRCRTAWREILSAATQPAPARRVGVARTVGSYLVLPEVQWVLGREMKTSQPCRRRRDGGTIALY